MDLPQKRFSFEFIQYLAVTMMTFHPHTTGILYIVATPIGNLEDITLRAIRILKEVDVIAAEDTRHTKKLLNHLGIQTRLISYYREKEAERADILINRLKSGDSVALVSDAGTPGISDPGALLVGRALSEGIPVTPLPGPSALTAAVSSAGLREGSFLFLGFPPSKKSQRRKLLSSLLDEKHPIIFYESPHRIQDFLTDALAILGDRQAFWARELTKTYEELQQKRLSQLLEIAGSKKNRGEFVLIIHPGKSVQAEGENMEELLLWYRDNTELSLKDASRRLASDLGLSRSQVYQKALELWKM